MPERKSKNQETSDTQERTGTADAGQHCSALTYNSICFVLFYAVWAVVQLVIHPAVLQVIPEESVLSQILFDWVLKNLFWTVPALLCIRHFQGALYISAKELFRNPTEKKQVLLVLLAETGFCLFSSFCHHKGFYFRAEGIQACVGFVFVGITEELVFRGWLLNSSLSGMQEGVQEERLYFRVFVNALLFLSIHFPIWILQGNFTENFANLGFLSILGLSVFFSWVMLHFRNIWVAAAVHTLWDVLVTVLN